jgi:hypothetical protein
MPTIKTPILGGSYTARSLNEAANRMINLYSEVTPEVGKEAGYLMRCPGTRLVATVGTGPIRGMWQSKSVLYVVSGNGFYRVGADWIPVFIGNVDNGVDTVSMSDNGYQVFIACNPRAFIYNITTAVFAEITDTDFVGARSVAFIGGYFVFNEPFSQRVWVTSLLDGTAIDPLDFASAEAGTDNIRTLIADHKEIWLFGANTIEVWYNAGNVDYPLSPISGAYIETGIEAYRSLAKCDNSLFWLGSDTRGDGIVYRTNGYTPVRVSTHALEWQIQNYGKMTDAIGYSYQMDGHLFYVLTFPSANKTWCYDISTGLWHERGEFNETTDSFTRHRSNCQAYFNEEIITGDFDNGNIYAFDLAVYTDNGNINKWVRSWRALPTGQNDLKRTIHHSLQLDCETGRGTATGQGQNPLVNLRWSDDGGHTWGNYHAMSLGAGGAWGTRVIWRRLGMTTKLRDRIYEISGTDPVRMAIMGAQLDISATRS